MCTVCVFVYVLVTKQGGGGLNTRTLSSFGKEVGEQKEALIQSFINVGLVR